MRRRSVSRRARRDSSSDRRSRLSSTSADTRTAPHSDLQAYTATLYVLVAGSGGVVVDPGVMLVRRGDASTELFGAVLDACASSADATSTWSVGCCDAQRRLAASKAAIPARSRGDTSLCTNYISA